jgi:hypothetical protein
LKWRKTAVHSSLKSSENGSESPKTGVLSSESGPQSFGEGLIRIEIDRADPPTEIVRQVARATDPSLTDAEIVQLLRDLARLISEEIESGAEW